MSLVRIEFSEWIGSIAFDNYVKRNALGADLIAEVIGGLDQLKGLGARVVVLRSAYNEKVWSSGHDVDELPKANLDPLPYNDPLEQLLRCVKSFPAPVIAMVHGSVWGGACDLIMACDIVIADETSSFAITPAKLGLPYNAVGFLDFMARLPLTIVKEMFFTADPIPADRAEHVGIVNMIVPASDLRSSHLCDGQDDLDPLTVRHCCLEGGDLSPERSHCDQPRHLRIPAWTAPQRLYGPGLPRRHTGIPGEAGTEIPRQSARF